MKTNPMRNLALAALAGLIAGCSSYSLQELRRTTPQGTPFQNALAAGYMEFAAEEEKVYDWLDSWHFADKGLMSAYGKTVGPEDLKEWNIPEARLAEMEQGRAVLMAVLTSPAIDTHPELAARAQVAFDCWVEQQEEGWDVESIEDCREDFREALSAIAGGPEMQAAPVAAHRPAVAAPKRPAQAPAVDTDAYVVFFEKGQINLSVSGKRVVEEVSRTLANMKARYEVVLNSHTDTAGDAKANLKITEQRAQTVKQKLVEGGVHEDDIRIFAFGEPDPPVKTGDGVDEPANRRVEIYISE